MLQQCFFLLVFITTAITINMTNISFSPDGVGFTFQGQQVQLYNLRPSTVQLGMTSINSTSTGLTVTFADPLQATLLADAVVNNILPVPDVAIQANIYGYLHMTKKVFDTCNTESVAMTDCNMKLQGVATLPSIGDMTMEEQDVCDVAGNMVTELLTPKQYAGYPAAMEGTTRLSRSTYMLRLKMLNLFADATGLPVESEFVAANVIRMAIGTPVGTPFQFDSSHASDVEVFDAIAVLAKLAKKMLNVTVDPAKADSTVIPYGSDGAIEVPTLRSVIHRAIAEGTMVALQTYTPRASGIVFDIIVNDFRCKLLNTVCSVPATDAVQVINSRFGGLGDLGTILDNTAGDRVDALLTNVTKAAFRIAGSTLGDRTYLPML